MALKTINTVLVHFKKISNFHVFCTQTYMQNVDFGQSLCRRASTKRCVTSRPIFANLVSKDAEDLKEKTDGKLCRNLRRSRGSRRFRTGGGGGGGPPVKIGLSQQNCLITN